MAMNVSSWVLRAAVEATSDRRFDPNVGVQLLLEIAEGRALELILKKGVTRAVDDAQFVFSQV